MPAKLPVPVVRPATGSAAVIRGRLRYTRSEWNALPHEAKLIDSDGGDCFVRLRALGEHQDGLHAEGPTLARIEFVAVSEVPYACAACASRFAADWVGGSCPTCDVLLRWVG